MRRRRHGHRDHHRTGLRCRPIRYELDGDGIATVTLDAPGAPVNTMTPQWQADLAEAADGLERDKAQIKGVLLVSAKTTFFAGAELNSVLKLKAEDAAAGFKSIEAMKRSFRRIETLGRPVVALLNGAALGGGWEVALAAHARFALDDRKIQFGTPEVSLGLIPGATGITKTVRLLGLMAAQPYLLEGQLFGPREALELGLVQGLGDSIESLRAQALAWIAEHPDATQPWDRKDYKMPGGTPASPKIAAGLVVAPAMLAQKTRGLYPAAHAILEAMVEGAMVDYDTATRIESRKLAKTMVSQTTKNMVTAFFFNLNAIKSGKSRPAGVPRWKPTKVGVLGAGMMGAGIAHADRLARLRLRAQGRERRQGAGRLRSSAQAHRAAGGPRPHERSAAGAVAEPDHADRWRGRAAGLRSDHRSRVRAARSEGHGHARSRADARGGWRVRLQHVDAADHRPGRKPARGRPSSSACTSSRRCTR